MVAPIIFSAPGALHKMPREFFCKIPVDFSGEICHNNFVYFLIERNSDMEEITYDQKSK